jgi:hypothetical protein
MKDSIFVSRHYPYITFRYNYNQHKLLLQYKNNPTKIKSLDIIVDTYRDTWKDFLEMEI